MRHTPEQLHDLLNPFTQHFHDALYAGCRAAGRSGLGRVLGPDKKSMFSHAVRSEAYEYLRANPLDDFELSAKHHRFNQAVVLHHKSGLELRIVRLASFHPSLDQPITGLSEDPAITRAITTLNLQFQAPGVVGISWERPDFEGKEPVGQIPLTAIRSVEGRKLRDGRADAIIPLHGTSSLIPEFGFDPDLADTRFKIEEEDTDDAL